MDPLRKDDLERARSSTVTERAAQTLAAMRSGIALKRAALVARAPHASAEEIDARLKEWLAREH